MTRSLDQALLQGADVSAMANMNLLVNGFHNVSQQVGSSAVSVGAATYVTDQWYAGGAGSWVASVQQVASPFPSQPDVPNGLKISVTTAEATLAAGDYITCTQPLEGANLGKLLYGSTNAKAVTLVFMVRPSVALTGYVSLFNSTTTRSYAARYTANANTDNFIYLTIPGDIVQSLTLSNALSMAVRWCFGTGTTYQGTAGVWTGNNTLAGSDVTNLMAAAGNNVILSAAVMLPGIVPISQQVLPLLARPYDDEFRKCQRYYTTFGGILAGNNASGGGIYCAYALPVTMRTSPSVTYAGVGYGNASALSANGVGPSFLQNQATITSSGYGFAYATNILNARM